MQERLPESWLESGFGWKALSMPTYHAPTCIGRKIYFSIICSILYDICFCYGGYSTIVAKLSNQWEWENECFAGDCSNNTTFLPKIGRWWIWGFPGENIYISWNSSHSHQLWELYQEFGIFVAYGHRMSGKMELHMWKNGYMKNTACGDGYKLIPFLSEWINDSQPWTWSTNHITLLSQIWFLS